MTLYGSMVMIFRKLPNTQLLRELRLNELFLIIQGAVFKSREEESAHDLHQAAWKLLKLSLNISNILIQIKYFFGMYTSPRKPFQPQGIITSTI